MMSDYRHLTFKVNADSEEIRTETLNGVDHLVIPVVALVEGVLHPSNAPRPELALASEFGKVPAGWNGRPIMFGHPKNADGEPVSANSPDLWDSEVIGMLFNTHLDGKKLKGEIWLNTEKAPKELQERFQDPDEVVEVSTGLFAQTEKRKGVFNGETYYGIWRDIVPDHLAVLDEGVKGACSVEDGCGAPRINQLVDLPMPMPEAMLRALTSALKIGDCGCGAGGKGGTCACQPSAKQAESWTKILDQFFVNAKDRSDTTKRSALYSALQVETPNEYVYVLDVFDKTFVYMCYKEGQFHTYRRGYRIRDDGTVVLSSEMEEVRAETDYVPVSVSIQEQSQPKGAIMPEPTQLEKTLARVTELEGQLSTANTAITALQASNKELTEKAEALTKTNETTLTALEEARKRPATLDEYVASAPESFRAQLSAFVAASKAHRAGLVKALSEKTQMTGEDLEKLDTKMLESLAKGLGVTAETVSFAGSAPAPRNNATGSTQAAYAPPLEVFPRDKAAA